MALPDTTGRLAHVAYGEALTFTTSAGQVDELRRRVFTIAATHNERHDREATTWPAERSADVAEGDEDEAAGTPPSRAIVDLTEAGARLVLVANEVRDIVPLRRAVLGRAEYLQLEGCEMLASYARE